MECSGWISLLPNCEQWYVVFDEVLHLKSWYASAYPKILCPCLLDFGFPDVGNVGGISSLKGPTLGTPAKPLQLWYLGLDNQKNIEMQLNIWCVYIHIFAYTQLYTLYKCISYTYSTNAKHWWMCNDFLIVMVVFAWRVGGVFVTISLRLRTSPADSDLVGWLLWPCFSYAGKGRCKDNSCGNPSLEYEQLHDVGCFFQAVEEWLQPMIMFGIPRCHSFLLPFATLEISLFQDHLVKLLLLGDSAVGKCWPQNVGGHLSGFPPCCWCCCCCCCCCCCRHNEEVFRWALICK